MMIDNVNRSFIEDRLIMCPFLEENQYEKEQMKRSISYQ